MDASEIGFIEARLAASSRKYPSPDEMERYIARARRERNQEIAARFGRFIGSLKSLAGEVRRVAVACTAARLYQHKA